MPTLINKNHWCLAIANSQTKTFLFINPYGSSANETKRYFSKFRFFYEHYGAVKAWRCEVLDHVKQKDDFNCGVHIIQFACNYVRQKSLLECEDPQSFRKYLRNYLLMASDDVRNICLYCGWPRRSANETETWFACDRCFRWVHDKCISKPRPRYSLPKVEFICDVCRMSVDKNSLENQFIIKD